ncbi:hypothetical protein [Raoultella planticola]|jgi:hypothetical protein|uniref:hypothetical protein n=1 Tax=Raoultella planticola TaxID=575 RepID=UPI00358DA63A
MTTFEQQYLSRFSELSAFSRTGRAGCLAESHVECMLIHPFRGESEHCGNSQSRPFWVGIPGEWLKQVLAICNESVLVNLQGKKRDLSLKPKRDLAQMQCKEKGLR